MPDKEKNDENHKVILQQDDPEILKKLQEYEEHTSVFCIMCGYDGLMGIEGKHIPWYLTWWMIIPFALVGYITIVTFTLFIAVVLFVMRVFSEKYSYRCPNCNADLISQ